MVLVSAGTAIYYNMVLAWAFYYMFASFRQELPWANCDKKITKSYECMNKYALNLASNRQLWIDIDTYGKMKK